MFCGSRACNALVMAACRSSKLAGVLVQAGEHPDRCCLNEDCKPASVEPPTCRVASWWSSRDARASSTAAGASTSSFILTSSWVEERAAPLLRPL